MNESLSDQENACAQEKSLSAGDLPSGTVISGFRIEREIGRGGMGVVYLATQLNLQRYAALKILADELSGNAMFVQRFFQEAHSAACLSHSNIVQAYDAGTSSGLCYFAMEYVDGETLEVFLHREGALPPRSVMELGARIACALEYAWQNRGMCHGDIKPDNILIGRNGELKLADLGLAKSIYDEDVPRDVMVTPLYAAPEIISGKITEPNLLSDIYSFGASLYHSATGTPPFNSEAIEDIYRRHLEELPVPPSSLDPKIPENLSSLILKMLEKDPQNRPSSWQEIEDACRSMLEDAAPADAPSETVGKKISLKSLFLILSLPVLLAAGAFFMRIFHSPPPKPPAVQNAVRKSVPEKKRIESLEWNIQEKERIEKDEEEKARNIASYLRISGSFCSMIRFAPFYGPKKTAELLRSCRSLIRLGKSPHLAAVRGETESHLKTAEQILELRSASFRELPRIPKKKTVRKKTVPRKRIDHDMILFRILSQFRSRPQQLKQKLEDFSRRYRKNAPVQSKLALWCAEAMTPPEELLPLFRRWNQALKGMPVSEFGKNSEFYELDQNSLWIQFRDGIMRLRNKYPAAPVNMQKVRDALMRSALRPDFRDRFPEEVQRYVVISILFQDFMTGKKILSGLDQRMQKELAPLQMLIRRSAEH